MFDERLNRKIEEYIENMPSLPTSINKILELCNDPQTNAGDLSYAISLDPVLVGRLLKLLNSAYYGISHRVTNLFRATIMLGINTVKNLALSSAVLGSLAVNKDYKGLNIEGFWRHSLCVGVTAKLLAKKQGIAANKVEEHFSAGLLHDIGKIPLNAVLSKDYFNTVAAADRTHKFLFSMEEENLGINHSRIGTMIAKSWKLDGAVADVIEFHHNPGDYSGNHKTILSNVVIANYFAAVNEIGFAGDRSPEKPATQFWQSVGINEDVLEGILKTVNSEIEKAKVFLNI
jgi:putative nucleotidyltransferase with HDIG domain